MSSTASRAALLLGLVMLPRVALALALAALAGPTPAGAVVVVGDVVVQLVDLVEDEVGDVVAPECGFIAPLAMACAGPLVHVGEPIVLSLGWTEGSASTGELVMAEEVAGEEVFRMHCVPRTYPLWNPPVNCAREGTPVFHTEARLVMRMVLLEGPGEAAVGEWHGSMH